MEENLLLSDYIILALEFEENPEDLVKQQKLQEYLDKIIIRNYIPLKEKELLMMKILANIHKDFDAPGAAAFLEISKVSIGALAYCVNIENDVTLSEIMYDVCDVCHQYGLYDLIMKYCADDYKQLCEMVNNTINFGNINRLIQTTSLFGKEEFDKWEKSIEELKTHLNSEEFKALTEVVNSNDPTVDGLLKTLQEDAYNSVNREIQGEKDKINNTMEVLNKENKENKVN